MNTNGECCVWRSVSKIWRERLPDIRLAPVEWRWKTEVYPCGVLSSASGFRSGVAYGSLALWKAKGKDSGEVKCVVSTGKVEEGWSCRVLNNFQGLALSIAGGPADHLVTSSILASGDLTREIDHLPSFCFINETSKPIFRLPNLVCILPQRTPSSRNGLRGVTITA